MHPVFGLALPRTPHNAKLKHLQEQRPAALKTLLDSENASQQTSTLAIKLRSQNQKIPTDILDPIWVSFHMQTLSLERLEFLIVKQTGI